MKTLEENTGKEQLQNRNKEDTFQKVLQVVENLLTFSSQSMQETHMRELIMVSCFVEEKL